MYIIYNNYREPSTSTNCDLEIDGIVTPLRHSFNEEITNVSSSTVQFKEKSVSCTSDYE